MTLRLALCFLFHQNLGEPAARASRICYRGVLDILRNHPRLKFNLMLSGTLLDALCWFDAPFMRSVRMGVDEGQFRLLGSTYAQSLIPAGEDWDNAHQITLHRSTLKKYFNVEPSVFWSPRRAWKAGMASLLADAGYRFLPLEGSTLRAAGAVEPRVHALSDGGGRLNLLWDDAPARARFDFAVWHRREDVWRESLAAWQSHPQAEQLFPIISEDAAAFGLWGYDAGLDPRADFTGLDQMLDAIGREAGLETSFAEDAPAPESALAAVPTGWGEELDRALSDPEAPLHEEGYTDWQDFLARAPRIEHFRRIFGAVRTRMTSAEAGLAKAESPDAGARLFALATRAYCAHQSEFGAVGIGGRGDPAWEGVGAAIAVAKAAEQAAAQSVATGGGVIDDLTGDGEDEILLRSGDFFAVLSPYGGRLLHWIDLRGERLHVGNPLAAPVGSLLIEAQSPELASLPDDWLPEDGGPIREQTLEPDPGRRGVRLARQYLPPDGTAVPAWPRPQRTNLRPAQPARRRAFNDFLSIDDGPEEHPEPRLDFRLARGAVTFLRFFGYRLRMTKRIRLTESGLRVVYRFWNVNSRTVKIRLRTVSELCPDYQCVLDSPGRALEPVRFGPRALPGILNLKTDCALVLHASRTSCEAVAFRPGVLAWEVEQTFLFTVDAGKSEMLILRLMLHPGIRQAQGVLPAGNRAE